MLRLLALFCLFVSSSPSLPYAEWAHYHMVWLHNSHTDQVDIQAMFDNYLEHRIQVGRGGGTFQNQVRLSKNLLLILSKFFTYLLDI
jgi:hypothetical protein